MAGFSSLFRRRTTGKLMRNNSVAPPTSADALREARDLQVPLHEISTAIAPVEPVKPTAPIKSSRSMYKRISLRRTASTNNTLSGKTMGANTHKSTSSTSSFASFASSISVSARSVSTNVGNAKRRTMEFVATPMYEGQPVFDDYDGWEGNEDGHAGDVIF